MRRSSKCRAGCIRSRQRYRPLAEKEVAGAGAQRERAGPVEAIVDAVDELARWWGGGAPPHPRATRRRAGIPAGRARDPRGGRGAAKAPSPAYVKSCRCSRGCRRRSRSACSSRTPARRIVLATNVAETSLTVPGIRYVVDPGLARIKRYSYPQQGRAAAGREDIAGRAPTSAPGAAAASRAACASACTTRTTTRRAPAYTEPEILRSSLAGVILRMKSLHLGEVEDFPFLDPPLPKRSATATICSPNSARSTKPTI